MQPKAWTGRIVGGRPRHGAWEVPATLTAHSVRGVYSLDARPITLALDGANKVTRRQKPGWSALFVSECRSPEDLPATWAPPCYCTTARCQRKRRASWTVRMRPRMSKIADKPIHCHVCVFQIS